VAREAEDGGFEDWLCFGLVVGLGCQLAPFPAARRWPD